MLILFLFNPYIFLSVRQVSEDDYLGNMLAELRRSDIVGHKEIHIFKTKQNRQIEWTVRTLSHVCTKVFVFRGTKTSNSALAKLAKANINVKPLKFFR